MIQLAKSLSWLDITEVISVCLSFQCILQCRENGFSSDARRRCSMVHVDGNKINARLWIYSAVPIPGVCSLEDPCNERPKSRKGAGNLSEDAF